jgi:metacaspase-1
MPIGISLHIGLNSVDPAQYQGWDGKLAACEFDANDMAAIAKKRGFAETTVMLTKDATADAVKAAITAAAKKLKKDDLLLLTYSGHGGQVPDRNGDEPDRMDETWVLYDRQLIDDEAFSLYSQFKTGVRLLVLSDSCHSGTVVREMPSHLRGDAAESNATGGGAAIRMLPPTVRDAVNKAQRKLNDRLQAENPPRLAVALKASLILISGCQDNQYSLDGDRNGLFTGNLRKVWNNGRFKYGYRRFRDTIAAAMPPSQTPNYLVLGPKNAAFEAQIPFTIG